MKIEPLISQGDISRAVDSLAERIRADYAGRSPLVIGCLTGSFIFMADLVRRLGIPVECDFMKVSSYGGGREAGEIRLLLDHMLPVEGRDVIVVEDIVDTGASLSFVRERIAARRPASVCSKSAAAAAEAARFAVSRESGPYCSTVFCWIKLRCSSPRMRASSSSKANGFAR